MEQKEKLKNIVEGIIKLSGIKGKLSDPYILNGLNGTRHDCDVNGHIPPICVDYVNHNTPAIMIYIYVDRIEVFIYKPNCNDLIADFIIKNNNNLYNPINLKNYIINEFDNNCLFNQNAKIL